MKKLMQSKFFAYALIACAGLGSMQLSFAIKITKEQVVAGFFGPSGKLLTDLAQMVSNKYNHGAFKTNSQLNDHNAEIYYSMSKWVEGHVPNAKKADILPEAQAALAAGTKVEAFLIIFKSPDPHYGIVDATGKAEKWYLHLVDKLSRYQNPSIFLDLVSMRARYNTQGDIRHRIFASFKDAGEELFAHGFSWAQKKTSLKKVMNNLVAKTRSKLDKDEASIEKVSFEIEPSRVMTGDSKAKAYNDLAKALKDIGFAKSVGFLKPLGNFLDQKNDYNCEFTNAESKRVLNTLVDIECAHGLQHNQIVAMISALASQYDNASDLLRAMHSWLGNNAKFVKQLKKEALKAIASDKAKLVGMVLQQKKATTKVEKSKQEKTKLEFGQSFKHAYGPNFDKKKFNKVARSAGYSDEKIAELLKSGLDKDTLKFLKKKITDKSYFKELEKGFVCQQVLQEIQEDNVDMHSGLFKALGQVTILGHTVPKLASRDMAKRLSVFVRMLVDNLDYDVKKVKKALKSGLTKDMRTELINVVSKDEAKFVRELHKAQKEAASSDDSSVSKKSKESNADADADNSASDKKAEAIKKIKKTADKALNLAKDNPTKAGGVLAGAALLAATAYTMHRGQVGQASHKSENAMNEILDGAAFLGKADLDLIMSDMKLVSSQTKLELKAAIDNGENLNLIAQAVKEEIEYNKQLCKKAGMLGQLKAGIVGFEPKRKPGIRTFAPVVQQPVQQPQVVQPVAPVIQQPVVQQPVSQISVDPWKNMDAFSRDFLGLLDPQNNGL